tara:strand:+ start:6623 stop:7606 length:984 start_codon:yes stop_codon:yes gene_type:complete
MYGKRELTMENIRLKVNSYDLFKYYCLPFKEINIRFCSEMRQDRFPTCSIQAFNDRLFYKDFATGESFDDLGYMQHKYSIDFRTCLAYINRDFDLGLSGQAIEGVPTMQFFGVPDQTVDIGSYIKESAVITVQRRAWSLDDKEYWKDKYEFTAKQLDYFRVFPLKFFWINGKVYSCKKNTYGYFMGVKDGVEKWKIYQPLGPKEVKWFSNIGKYDLQGYDQLPESGDVLYITSSLKDVITLRKLGFYAVAPSAESTIIPEEIIEELRKRFPRLIIFYDNDEPGIRASAKHSKLYLAEEMCIPTTAGVKDPSDFVDKYNYDKLLKQIL